MTDDFAEGWMEFELAVDRIKSDYHLTKKDLEQYFKMYLEDHPD